MPTPLITPLFFGDGMEESKVPVEKAMEFARIAERAYLDEHGFDFTGMHYGFTPRYYGWAITGDKFTVEAFRRNFAREYGSLHRSDGSVIDRGDPEYFSGPVTLISPYADRYQFVTIHELGHQAFRGLFALDHKPREGKVSIPAKVGVTVDEGCADFMPGEKMHDLLDRANAMIIDKNIAKYKQQLNHGNGFEVWKKSFSLNSYGYEPDCRHAVGYNFVLSTWDTGDNLSTYLDRIRNHIPTEQDMLNPRVYLKAEQG
jgi:hypothetical protein